MSELHYLSLGYIVFVVLIVGEALWGWWRQRYAYRLGEAVVNVGHGMVFQVADLFTKTLFMLPFIWVSTRSAPHALPLDAWWGWLIGLFAYDFCTYWRHRHHHEVNFLWAVHACHHAAEDFNFAGALRQALFGNVFGWLWTLPLAFVMPFEMFVGIIVFDYLYQFVQHTRHVPKLGPLEWLLNTPSHHRVHHGTQPQYLDRNYGGIFIIWDRIFGTFEVEGEEPVYGITQPLGTLNPVWANFAPWAALWRASRRAATLTDAVRVWLVGPGKTASIVESEPALPRGTLENGDIPRSVLVYVIATFSLNVAVLVALIWTPEDAWLQRLVLAAMVIAEPAFAGALLERRRWAWWGEGLRLAVGGVALFALAFQPPATWSVAASVVVGVLLAPMAISSGWIGSRENAEKSSFVGPLVTGGKPTQQS